MPTLPSLPDGLRLMVITEPAPASGIPLGEVVEAALRGGATSVQLRDKIGLAQIGRPPQDLLFLAVDLRARCERHGALFLVNDHVELALASGAHGVHVGLEDRRVDEVRRVAPQGFVIGFSAATADEARAGARLGADYLGCGPVWATPSKADAGDAIGTDRLREVVRATPLPVVAIGGITAERSPRVQATGAAGVAVIGAVMGVPDPEGAARALVTPFR
jgi:thiamine-phosphate pyrophosphorylase